MHFTFEILVLDGLRVLRSIIKFSDDSILADQAFALATSNSAQQAYINSLYTV